MKYLLLFLIRTYQLTLSALVGRRCRYLPTCSDYARHAIEKHGAGRGFLLGLSIVSGTDQEMRFGGPIGKAFETALDFDRLRDELIARRVLIEPAPQRRQEAVKLPPLRRMSPRRARGRAQEL